MPIKYVCVWGGTHHGIHVPIQYVCVWHTSILTHIQIKQKTKEILKYRAAMQSIMKVCSV